MRIDYLVTRDVVKSVVKVVARILILTAKEGVKVLAEVEDKVTVK